MAHIQRAGRSARVIMPRAAKNGRWHTGHGLSADDPHGETINMASMSGAVTAQWYDPENGTYQPISGSSRFPNTGTHNFTPSGNNSGGDGDWVLVLETVASPLQILTGSLPSATTGAAYSSQILATGGSPPYFWSLTTVSPSLPPSLSFSTQGVLSGMPTMAGIFTLMVQVLDSTNALAT